MGNPPARGTADVLLELLGKVPDASTLEVLLEPEHLIALLRSHGWADAAVRRQLRDGGSPGKGVVGLARPRQ